VSIADAAFKFCEYLPSIAVPDSVKIIGDEAFYQCKSVTKINLPDGLTSIGKESFYECKSLTDITIPESVTEIGEEAFEFTPYQKAIYADNYFIIENNVLIDGKRCEGTAVIPEGVTEIGNEAFSYNSQYWGPYHVIMPNTVTYIGKYAFAGSRINEPHIPDSVTFIDDCAFQECQFGQVSIPGSVKTIADRAFHQCANLLYVTLGEGVEYISNRAFANCEHLREIIIPESVTYIADNAFENDEKLTIKGIAGSYAEQFAKEHSIPFVAIKEIPAITTTETTTTTTTTQLIPLNNRNAFITIQAESADVLEGIEVAEQSDEVTCIGYIENGDYVIYKDIDFADGAVKFMIMASGADEGTVEVHLDSPEGALLGSVTCEPTGDWLEYRQFETAITPTDGIHDLCLLFKGDGEYVMNVDSFVFAKAADSILYGDVNQDKSVSVADAVLLCKYISELEGTVISDSGLTASDMDQDGLLTIMDVSRILIQLELSFPIA
ncbi:MAG: leucine-rich repeat protein, partial [Acutalibacteraceae bacterium]|nr:leucine-rich repeat protein [Acutalibacteraceae bacterium]